MQKNIYAQKHLLQYHLCEAENWEQEDFNQATMKNDVYQAFTVSENASE